MTASATGSAPQSALDLLARQPLANYALSEFLAAGEGTLSFKAEDRTIPRQVRVKFIRPHPAFPDSAETFFSEAKGIARVRHPMICRGLDAGRFDGGFHLVHEFGRGETLAARMARRQAGKLHEREALPIVRGTAEALQGLFKCGQRHGNLKPGNMLLGEGNSVRLLDIGFAWFIAYPGLEAAFRAEPRFFSPERLDDDPNADIRGDLYSLGAIWHWLLLGEPPFRDPDPAEILRKHREERPVSVREADPRISAATSGLVSWLLEKDRDARPRTPQEFLSKLKSHPMAAEPAEGLPECRENLREG